MYELGSSQNAKELFNLRHASARNCFVRTLVMFQSRFKILKTAAGYDKQVSAAIFYAVCCLHNFITVNGIPINHRKSQPSIEKCQKQVSASLLPQKVLSLSAVQRKKKDEEMRDKIADEMWRSYQALMRCRRFRPDI